MRVLRLARPVACASCSLRGPRPLGPWPLGPRPARPAAYAACGSCARRGLAACAAYGLRSSRPLRLECGLSRSRPVASRPAASRPAASRPSALRPSCAACGLSARGFSARGLRPEACAVCGLSARGLSASRPALPALASRPSRRTPRVSCLVAAGSRGTAVPPRPGEGVVRNPSLALGAGGDPWSQASAPRARWAYSAIWKPASGAPALGGAPAFMLSPRQRRAGGYITARTRPNASNYHYGITAVG